MRGGFEQRSGALETRADLHQTFGHHLLAHTGTGERAMNDAGSSAQHAPKSRPSGACASTGGGDRAFLKEMSGDESEEESDGDDSLLGILRDGTVSEEGQSEQGE